MTLIHKQRHLPAEEKKTFIHVYKQRHLPAEEKKNVTAQIIS